MAILEFHQDMLQEIIEKADAEELLRPEAFFEIYTDEMIELGDISERQIAFYEKEPSPGVPGVRIDGYGGDPNDSTDKSLAVFISDFNQSEEIVTMNRSQMTNTFKKLSRFLETSFDKTFRDGLEPTNPIFGLTDLLITRWDEISKINMFLLTNKSLNIRGVDRIDDIEEIGSKKVSLSVWDLKRMEQNASSEKTKEDMEIDFKSDLGGSLPALKATISDTNYQSYMTVISGSQLADIYERWGDRLLEQNVRVFLQAQGGVNRGLRNTIYNEPGMFFAYNNGITATAEEVKFGQSRGQITIEKIKNLQIVNGGQTTGSIYHAKLQKKDLSEVFVQMKLSVIDADESEKIIPNISRYANSQNKVNLADLSANHPFHRTIEEASRRIWAPMLSGSMRRTKWFYERARGQHKQERAIRNTSDTRNFDKMFPTKNPETIKFQQKFNKTDLAKFDNLWNEKPHEVAKGAQTNYSSYFLEIDKKWEKNQKQFNDRFYHHLIAKAIIFKATEVLVSNSNWYQTGGPRAQIVAYSISKIAHDIRRRGQIFNFDQVWENQDISHEMETALNESAKKAYELISNTPSEGQLVTQWAKREACWTRLANLPIDWGSSLETLMISKSQNQKEDRDAKNIHKSLTGIQAQHKVINAGEQFWSEVRDWSSQNVDLSPRDKGIISIILNMKLTGKIPTVAQCEVIIETVDRLIEFGFPNRLPENSTDW